MARRDTNRGVSIPYRPGSPPHPQSKPEELVRAVWEDLGRVSIAMGELDHPMGSAVYCNEQVTISKSPAVVWDRLFNEGVTNVWSNPASAMDTTTGTYTIAQEGVYNVLCRLSVPAFPTPAVKEYSARLRMTIEYVNGSPSEIFFANDGGIDTVPLTVIGTFLYPLTKGDKITVDAAIDHETKTGVAQVTAGLQLFRVSSSGNNNA